MFQAADPEKEIGNRNRARSRASRSGLIGLPAQDYSAVLMDISHDTIAAIATAPGMSALAVVRISGPGSLALADGVFSGAGQSPSMWPGNTFHRGLIIGKDGAVLDEVILLVMRGPKSYTREDVVEIQCHGGARSAARIMKRVLDMGARLAQPGEFTRRAFLNGRIDLAQAESIMDLISAATDRAFSAALEQLNGRLSREINRIYEQVLSSCADIEASLDFLDDELPQEVGKEIIKNIQASIKEVELLAQTWNEGHLVRDGALVVISGRPNAGKSTLMNALLGKDRAIVSHIPGTTRDTIEEQFVIEDVMIRLVDTAGLGDSSCSIEQDGVRRARALMSNSDLMLYIVDASQAMHPDDMGNIVNQDPGKTVIILNKSDLPSKIDPDFGASFSRITTSLINGQGLDAVKKAIVEKLRIGLCHEPMTIVSERHRQKLNKASDALKQGIELILSGDEFLAPAASYLREAAESLAEITGRRYYEEMLDNVFSRFCIGK